jgi:hypothetical protein
MDRQKLWFDKSSPSLTGEVRRKETGDRRQETKVEFRLKS